MQSLIKIQKNENGQQLVDARELHDYVVIKAKGGQKGEQFNHWIKRMIDHGFELGVDYTTIGYNYKGEIIEENGIAKFSQSDNQRVSKRDYILTLDMAKQIAMIQNNDKGREVRRYFIECEKKVKEALPQTKLEWIQLALEQEKELITTATKIQHLEEALDESEQWLSIVRASKEVEVNESYFNWRKLKKYSIENGIEIKEAPCPRYKTKKLYHLSVFKNCYPEVCSNIF